MKRMGSLYSKLSLILLGIFGLVGAVFVVSVTLTADLYQKEVNQKLNSDLAENIAAEYDLLENGTVNQEVLKNLFHNLMVINPSIELYLLDREGAILAYSAPPGVVKQERVDIQKVEQWLVNRPASPYLGDDPRHPGGEKPFSAARISGAGNSEGYLYVILGGERFDHVSQRIAGSYILQLGIWWGAVGLLFGLAAGLILFSLVTRRLKHLTSSVSQYRYGLPPPAVPLPRPGAVADEIDRLSAAFRQMAERIGTQVAELEKSHAQKRELVANVSHDLRTPLATLQSFIESILLKGDALDPENRRNYLQNALRHCGKLNRLVSQLFELAKLDSGEIKPDPEPINLGELVHDIVQEYGMKHSEPRFEIKIAPGAEISLVNADPGMIERVLENLLDNAIRHTGKEGSVSLGLSRINGSLLVEVTDTGRGIPPEDLPHVFDRYFQSNGTAQPDDKGSGLGLSIARRILELHGSAIQVRSTLNQGATFTFSLPVREPAFSSRK